MELALCEYIRWREGVIAFSNSGPGKKVGTWALRQAQEGLAACHPGIFAVFTTAALVHEVMATRAGDDC